MVDSGSAVLECKPDVSSLFEIREVIVGDEGVFKCYQ